MAVLSALLRPGTEGEAAGRPAVGWQTGGKGRSHFLSRVACHAARENCDATEVMSRAGRLTGH